MKLRDQVAHCDGFFRSCMDIFHSRGKEYTPEDVPLWDVFVAAAREDVSILTVLRILTDKHLTAVRHLELTGHTLGPTFQERFRDIANFQALQSFYLEHQTELHDTWRNHLAQSSLCACVVERPGNTFNPLNMRMRQCQQHQWLDAHPPFTKASLPAPEPSA